MSVTSKQGIESVETFFGDCSVFLLRKFGKVSISGIVGSRKNFRSYPDFLIIPTISGKADNYGLLLKKGRDNFFIKGRYPTARMQIPLRKKS